MAVRMKSIERIAADVYDVEIVRENGLPAQYTFEVREEPIPIVTWSDAFEAEVGTLSGEVKDLLAAVLAFHKANTDPESCANEPAGTSEDQS